MSVVSSITEFLVLVLSTWADVATTDPGAEVIADTDQRWAVAIAIVVVAGLSGMVGRAGLLAINRVRGLGVLVAWALTSVQLVIAHAVQGLVLWATAALVLGDAPSPGAVVRVVLLSTAPLWWAWLAIMPFLGPLVERVLWAWTLLTSGALMSHLMPGRSAWWVLAVVVLAWLLSRLVAVALNDPVHWLRNAVWQRVMGRPLRLSAAELLEAATPAALAQEHAPPLPQRTHLDRESATSGSRKNRVRA